ncbi:hypothetical protein R3W88_012405 [Solanum pinnatisectum]|uniref:Uncharacterized protein n=1 Tax=Solanum pinnatisectum TaxID=50273 RepID=A0AAV9LCS5_9SOLN|nr:hypothetical protein R3W88_012405 [Solanum pinnatisectum]
MINALYGLGEFSYAPNKLDLNFKNRETPPTKSSIDEPPKLELKALPSYLRYVFLGQNNILSVIIAIDLTEGHIKALTSMLRRFKRVIGWTIIYIIGIFSGICSHKIQLIVDCKLSIEH